MTQANNLKQLDLGCGGAMRQEQGYEYYGIDLVKSNEVQNVTIADLILDEIPFEDSYFDLVTAHDFLEHVPMVLYIPNMFGSPERRDCMIELFNEVYRVLKPDGKFYAKMPVYPHRAVFQDPQHLSIWTDETPNYFSGDYVGFHDHYGHTSRFELLEKHVDNNSHLHFTMRKVVADGEFKLKY